MAIGGQPNDILGAMGKYRPPVRLFILDPQAAKIIAGRGKHSGGMICGGFL
jgi:hypothetical protein